MLAVVQRVIIEVPRWSFVKRKPDGSLDFVAPLPSPFNYGSVVGTMAADRDPLDALVLGPRLAAGTELVVEVREVMGFCDGGVFDPKLVCSPRPLLAEERRAVERFFAVYVHFKRLLRRLRGQRGETAVLGWLPRE